MPIPEPDWKVFKRVREHALQRFCEQVLAEAAATCTRPGLSAHERYGELYGLIQDRNRTMALAFDEFRRSTAVDCIRMFRTLELLTDEEIAEFSEDTQYRTRPLDL